MTYIVEPPRNGLRLHLNENTAGCSPAVLAALRALERSDTSFYPDYGRITTIVEGWLGVPAGWVQLTNGLDEGLHVAAQAAARRAPGAATVIIEPAFEMYAACADAADLRQIHIAPPEDLSFPVDEVLRAVSPDVRLVSVTDPGNPTGLGVPSGIIERLAAAAPHAVVFVDEAYADFSGRTAIGPLLDRHRNVVVGRTFAKGHGLAALRAGALVAHPDSLAIYRRLLPPYSLNICAVRALEAALADRPYLDWYVAESVTSRRLLYDFCERHAFHYWPSEANFVLIRIGGRATELVKAVADRGVFIRDRTKSPGCAGCVRITAGVVADTRACVTAMEEALASFSN
ncbi:MAG TPA: histidinol-phosphate transaminase [Vicinamibacterales bacterium]|nr:histidinol-phosphate transaminase [Vicinamibacterales bacterium]